MDPDRIEPDRAPTSPAERIALATRAIALIDLTDLADDRSGDGIDELCRRAAVHHTAAVCVWPDHVARCADLLGGTGVHVATVVNFPTGDEPLGDVVAQTLTALDDGADEIDLVLPYRALLAGDDTGPAHTVGTIARLVESPRHLKVILESGAMPGPDLVGRAAHLAVDNGADFVKTSTGKIAVGATVAAARAMLEVIADQAAAGRTIGLKPSGGIRTLDDAAVYLGLAGEVMGDSWATPETFRFGASGLLDVLLEVIGPDVIDATDR